MGVNGKSEKDKELSVLHEIAEFTKKVLAADMPSVQKKEVIELFIISTELAELHM